MKRIVLFTLVLTVIFAMTPPSEAQILWRSAKTMKQGSFITMASWYYQDFTKSYNWTNSEWVDFPDGRSQTYWGINTMIGYGITNRWEGMIHIPVMFLSKEVGGVANNSSGMGDIYLKTRYAVLPWTKKHERALTLVGAARFGSGDTDAVPALGDGSTDFSLGGIYSSALGKKFVGHLKARYWLNGKDVADDDIGDDLKFIAALGYKATPKVMPRVIFILVSQGKYKDASGHTLDNTQKSRYNVIVDCVFRPQPALTVRPRLLFPVGGEGGAMYNFMPMIDIWYVFQI